MAGDMSGALFFPPSTPQFPGEAFGDDGFAGGQRLRSRQKSHTLPVEGWPMASQLLGPGSPPTHRVISKKHPKAATKRRPSRIVTPLKALSSPAPCRSHAIVLPRRLSRMLCAFYVPPVPVTCSLRFKT